MSEAVVNIEFFDTTLRDGAQALPEDNQFPGDSKMAVAELLASLGVGVIESGFPKTPSDGAEVFSVAKTVGNMPVEVAKWSDGQQSGTVLRPPVIAGLSRTTMDDIDATWEAVQDAARPRIHTFISTDSEHMQRKFVGKSPEQVFEMGRHAIRYSLDISSAHEDASVEFSAEAASTTEPDFLERVVKMAVDEGVDVINVPDTVGQRTPSWMTDFYDDIIRWVHEINPSVVVSAHNHNDMGLAVANSYSLVEAAVMLAVREQKEVNIQIESTVCGLGERAGNADIFPIVALLDKHTDDMPASVRWEFNRVLSKPLAEAIMDWAKLDVHAKNPIVGTLINQHFAGIHSDGILKGGEDGYKIYTPFDPRSYGHSESAIHQDGKYQGRAGRAAIRSTNSSPDGEGDETIQANKPKMRRLKDATTKQERDEIIARNIVKTTVTGPSDRKPKS
ncbi:MAG TPA: hypothetical protein VLE69_02985 [Candidatus Saccharimonadales bacterium]|nr:hypothetical protein [Candidatus Saccharimonadales bacterium]